VADRCTTPVHAATASAARLARPNLRRTLTGELELRALPGSSPHVVPLNRGRLRFLFATLGHVESDFYGRVGAELVRLGHEVAHVTYSRHAAALLRSRGFTAYCLPDGMAALGELDVAACARQIEADYDTPTFRDLYRTDFVCDGRPECWAVERTVRHVLAMERIFDHWCPDLVVPEVGNETIRTAADVVGRRHGVPVLLLFYTIFPNPLRLYVNTMHRPIVRPEEVRPLTASELAEVERFIAEFTRRDAPIREYRSTPVNLKRARLLVRHLAVRLLYDRDNPYLRPMHWLAGNAKERLRARAARAFYEHPREGRPYLYFPLHVADDYKLKRVIPHCADQLNLIEQVARALPHGYDLIVKEHPMAIGRYPLGTLRRLRRMRNVRIVEPLQSSHGLIRNAEAVAVISSTVGLEALLYGKPVLTLGAPFYSGFGVTLDIHDFGDIRTGVPRLLAFEPDEKRILQLLHAGMRACYPGAPAMVDRSDENARILAESLDHAGRAEASGAIGTSTRGRRSLTVAAPLADAASGERSPRAWLTGRDHHL
jgi:hypothetical protein